MRRLRIELQRDNNTHKEYDATARIHITLESQSCWIMFDSNDFRCTPSRIEIVFSSHCGQLQF